MGDLSSVGTVLSGKRDLEQGSTDGLRKPLAITVDGSDAYPTIEGTEEGSRISSRLPTEDDSLDQPLISEGELVGNEGDHRLSEGLIVFQSDTGTVHGTSLVEPVSVRGF